MMALILEKSLWPPIPKWSDDSASRKTKDCRQHALATFTTLALERGELLVTKKVLNTHLGLGNGWVTGES